MKKMKIKGIIFAMLLLLPTVTGFAQHPQWEKYAGREGMTYVFVSSAMLQMLPSSASFDTEGVKLSDIKDKLSSLQIVSAKNAEASRQLRAEITPIVSRNYEVLMLLVEEGSKVTFYATKQGEMINDLIMVTDSDTNFTIIQLLGRFTTSDIQNITKNTGN